MKTCRILVAMALMVLMTPQMAKAQNQQERLKGHLYYLASDSLRGRMAGSADARRAAEYIVGQFRDMGLQPWGEDYLHPFSLSGSSAATAAVYGATAKSYCNVVALIPGSDPQLKEEYIVIGAHYDHLGVKGGEVYNGADDNASGTAAIIEVARQLQLQRGKLQRSVIVAAFDAEEIGLCGSTALAEEMAHEGLLTHVRVMFSVDMVGWLRQGGDLSLTGTATLKASGRLLAEVADAVGIRIATSGLESSPITATDTEPFARNRIPTFAVTTGLKSPYHKPGDDAELIDYEGLDRVADYLTAVVLKMGSAEEALAPTGRVAYKHRLVRPRFEWGPVVGWNTGHMVFPTAAFVGDADRGFEGGLTARVNLGSFAIACDAHYQTFRAPFPSPTDAYNTTHTYRQQSLVVPLTLQWQLGNPAYAFLLGAGGYYAHVFSASMPTATAFHTDCVGFQWNFGLRLGRFSLTGTTYYDYHSLFAPECGLPEARMRTYSVLLGYYF